MRLKFFSLVFLGNLVAVSAALISYSDTGVDHFDEGGFITKLSMLQLLALSWLAYKIFQARGGMRGRSLWQGAAKVWIIIALGFLFLTADERFRIHENIDFGIHDIFNLPETPLNDRLDDALVGLYGLAGIGLLFMYRKEFSICRASFPYFIGGFILLFTMVAFDMLTNRNDLLPLLFDHHRADVLEAWLSQAEDAAKVFAEAFFIGAFYAIWQKVRRTEVPPTMQRDHEQQATPDGTP
jgi:hypothetical protein